MPRIELHPIEDPSTNGALTGSYEVVGTVAPTGTQPVLGDGSDATYYAYAAGGGVDSESTRFLLPQLGIDPTSVTDIGFHVRVRSDDGNPNASLNLRVYGYDSVLGQFSLYEGTTAPAGFRNIPLTGTLRTIDQSISAYNYGDFNFGGTMTRARLADFLSAPNHAQLIIGEQGIGGVQKAMTVTEAWLWVDYEGPVITTIPPLRQHPRSDGLGASSARRVTGSRSVQGSIRRAGGYL